MCAGHGRCDVLGKQWELSRLQVLKMQMYLDQHAEESTIAAIVVSIAKLVKVVVVIAAIVVAATWNGWIHALAWCLCE